MFKLITLILISTLITHTVTTDTKLNLKSHFKKELEKNLGEIIEFIIKVKDSDNQITANLNDIADELFKSLQDILIDLGYDPLKLNDIEQGFNYTLIFINYHGELKLTYGWLQGVSTLHRHEDVVLSYSSVTKKLRLSISLTFDTLSFNYDYSAKLMDIGPKGIVDGSITDLQVDVVVAFDFEQFKASVEKLDLVKSGSISVRFTGNGLIDWMINILADVVTGLMKNVILDVVEQFINNPVQQLVDAINEVIDGVLNPTTTTPSPERAKLILKMKD